MRKQCRVCGAFLPVRNPDGSRRRGRQFYCRLHSKNHPAPVPVFGPEEVRRNQERLLARYRPPDAVQPLARYRPPDAVQPPHRLLSMVVGENGNGPFVRACNEFLDRVGKANGLW